jgi:hypothetical protein
VVKDRRARGNWPNASRGIVSKPSTLTRSMVQLRPRLHAGEEAAVHHVEAGTPTPKSVDAVPVLVPAAIDIAPVIEMPYNR